MKWTMKIISIILLLWWYWGVMPVSLMPSTWGWRNRVRLTSALCSKMYVIYGQIICGSGSSSSSSSSSSRSSSRNSSTWYCSSKVLVHCVAVVVAITRWLPKRIYFIPIVCCCCCCWWWFCCPPVLSHSLMTPSRNSYLSTMIDCQGIGR